MKKPKMNFEEMWDYSYELLEEISRLIADLPESKFITSNKFIDINNKLNKAKSLWINISKYENVFFTFRCGLLNRKILDKINIIQSENIPDNYVFDISSIESNYLELKSDFDDISDVDHNFELLLATITQVKVWRMIKGYISWENNSNFDFENIMRELNLAKELWIDLSNLEEKIMDM